MIVKMIQDLEKRIEVQIEKFQEIFNIKRESKEQTDELYNN